MGSLEGLRAVVAEVHPWPLDDERSLFRDADSVIATPGIYDQRVIDERLRGVEAPVEDVCLVFYNEQVSRKVIHSINRIVDENDQMNAVSKLTENELTFLRLSCSEKTYQEIAAEMFKSEKTIDGYRAELFKKLNVTSRVGMVMFAIKNGIVQL